MSTLPVVLPLSRGAFTWLREGGPATRGDWRHRLSYRWQSYCFEKQRYLQRKLSQDCSNIKLEDPIFVLGLWRSGTTFLHELLSSCSGIIYPETWQCMRPSMVGLGYRPSAEVAVSRPMDGMEISAASPQEDEFALLALGVPTVYRGFLDPRRLNELAQWLEPESWDTDSPNEWLAVWKEFLANVARGQSGRFLLKSPPHSFRWRALAQAFPNAKYLWIVRDPEEVFFSNYNMWTQMFDRYALWSWDARELVEFLNKALTCATRSLSEICAALPRERLAVIDFRQLIAAPTATIGAANSRLQLGLFQEFERSVRRAAEAKTPRWTLNRIDQVMPEHVAETAKALGVAQAHALVTHGVKAAAVDA